MSRIYVFYRLKGDQYQLQFSGETDFVDKATWNNFVREQHNDRNGGISLSGGIHVELEQLRKLIGN